MKIQGKITILFDRDGLKIEVYDDAAKIKFLTVQLDQEQTCEALARIANTPCAIEAVGLKNVGKVRESQAFEFPMPEMKGQTQPGRKEVAEELIKELCPEGWTPSTYFGSKDSFYTRDGKDYARTTIFRWIEA